MSTKWQVYTVSLSLRTGGQMLPDTLAHNVIGELKGSEFPDQVITVGGHLDSWDPAEGAMDDGAGCVQSIEVLRALKAIGYRPRHTIRVVLFANEENGGRGGRKYAEAAKANGETHLLGLESDAGGFTPRAFTLSLSEDKPGALACSLAGSAAALWRVCLRQGWRRFGRRSPGTCVGCGGGRAAAGFAAVFRYSSFAGGCAGECE